MNSKNIPEVIKQLSEFGFKKNNIMRLARQLKNQIFTWEDVIEKINSLEKQRLATQTVQIKRTDRLL